MFKLVRRSIVANLGRLVLTLLSVVLGVSAVSGSFVLADSLRSVFDQISEDALAGTDAQVRPIPSEIADAFSSAAAPSFDESLTTELAALPEVARAEGQVAVFERIYTLDADGEIVRPPGPPVFANSFSGAEGVGGFRVVEGTAPGDQQVALDQAQATQGGFEIGDTIDVSMATGDIEQFELSGIIDFGDGGTGGAFFILMDLPTIQRATGTEGTINFVDLGAADDVSPEELVAAVSPSLPEGLEAVPQEVLIEEIQENFGQIIDFIGYVLLGFALVILFVSIFIIYNTFAILVGQRTRMLGLLRSIGASASQIRGMVLIESVLIGLIASITGLFGGLGIAWLLKAAFNSFGNAFPDGPLQLQPRTIVIVFAVGLGVTVISALIPAFRAAKVAPLEAVRGGGLQQRSLTFRVLGGSLVLAVGLLLLFLGLSGQIESTANIFVALGFGAALIFIGVTMLSALFAGVVASVIGRPVQALKGTTGRLARDNASRNPQRTSATATALMIGLALITGVAVLASSIVDNFNDVLEDAFGADLIVGPTGQPLPFSATLVDELAALDEVDVISAYQFLQLGVDGEGVDARAWDSDTGTTIFNMGLAEGSLDLGSDGIAVLDETAAEMGLSVGDSLTVEFSDGELVELAIKGLYDNSAAVDGVSYLVDRELANQHVEGDAVGAIGVTLTGQPATDSPEFAAAEEAIEAAAASQPQVDVLSNAELREELSASINQLQALILLLLGLCVIIAAVGIVNTLSLSVLERTREIGLLRAVGTTRSQLRTTIRWEAVIVSLFGSILGVVMGVALGWAVVTAIPDEFLSYVSIPWAQIAIYLVAGGIVGVLAAIFPGYRAANLNVLDAIAYE